MLADDDWRVHGQERYMMDLVFHWETYRKPSAEWDHDHCDFCWAKFMEEDYPDVLHEGYTAEDGLRWVCKQCFDDFKERFRFRVQAD